MKRCGVLGVPALFVLGAPFSTTSATVTWVPPFADAAHF